MLRWFTASAREADLIRRLADEQAAHEATRRQLRIAEAEVESLAAVIARDRQRVQAEAAGFARQRAESEGGDHARAR
jgi:hypothetical protein